MDVRGQQTIYEVKVFQHHRHAKPRKAVDNVSSCDEVECMCAFPSLHYLKVSQCQSWDLNHLFRSASCWKFLLVMRSCWENCTSCTSQQAWSAYVAAIGPTILLYTKKKRERGRNRTSHVDWDHCLWQMTCSSSSLQIRLPAWPDRARWWPIII